MTERIRIRGLSRLVALLILLLGLDVLGLSYVIALQFPMVAESAPLPAPGRANARDKPGEISARIQPTAPLGLPPSTVAPAPLVLTPATIAPAKPVSTSPLPKPPATPIVSKPSPGAPAPFCSPTLAVVGLVMGGIFWHEWSRRHTG